MEKKKFRKAAVRENLHRLDLLRKEILKPRFLEVGLTLGQGQPRILKFLYEKEPRSQKELAGLTGLDVTTMSRTLDRLADAGLIERRVNPECRRSCLIVLTQKGRETAGQVWNSFGELDERLCRGFSEEELETVCRALERLAANLEENRKSQS